MTIDSNKKKDKQLGQSHGSANNQLRKQIMFRLMQKCGEDICFQCGKKIESADDLSIEHKVPWLDNDISFFWDLDNIAFSHLKCNIGALDFHHLDPSEKDKSFRRTWSYKRLKLEAQKCVLLCSNCHREVEAGITIYPHGEAEIALVF